MNRDTNTLALFFPQPLDGQDIENLQLSGIKRVQMFLGVAYTHIPIVRRLADLGVRLTIRLEEPRRGHPEEVQNSYYTMDKPLGIIDRVKTIQQHITVEAIICGNEPENEYDLTKDGENWGNQAEPGFTFGRVWMHNWALGNIRRSYALHAIGDIPIVAPGWSHKRVTPVDPPQPGRQTWATITADEYARGPVGLHAYALLYDSQEDTNRLLWHIGEELKRIHTDAWINEINITRHVHEDNTPVTQLERMTAVLRFANVLLALPWAEQIKSFCPFVSNGLPDQSWSHMIMRDPACYRLLGKWLSSK